MGSAHSLDITGAPIEAREFAAIAPERPFFPWVASVNGFAIIQKGSECSTLG